MSTVIRDLIPSARKLATPPGSRSSISSSSRMPMGTVHEYSPEGFGIDRNATAERFQGCRQRFGVAGRDGG